MTDTSKKYPLIERMMKTREQYSLAVDKPQGLDRDELVKCVVNFILQRKELEMTFSYEESDPTEELKDTDARFDPIESYHADPSRIEDINMFVEQDMRLHEVAHLNRASTVMASRNLLLFGIAQKIARDESLSDDLKQFLVDYLLTPRGNRKDRDGRPNRTELNKEVTRDAIRFARKHGLKATRNDASVDENGKGNSACDIVSDAAALLAEDGYGEFERGYSFTSVKKIWQGRKKKAGGSKKK